LYRLLISILCSLTNALTEFSAVFWGMARRGLKQSTTKVEYKFKPHPDEYKNAAAIGDFLREVRLFTYKIDVVEWRAWKLA
jgi:hypothetical protein